MNEAVSRTQARRGFAAGYHLDIITRDQLADCPHWPEAFARDLKDRRYYEIVEDTIQPEFAFSYFAIKDADGIVCAVQPFFILDQDLLAGTNARIESAAAFIRKLWPRFLKMRTLMVGCAAGEGSLDGAQYEQDAFAEVIARDLAPQARKLGAGLIVLKEFPAAYRAALQCFVGAGYTRIPSLPMTRLNIDYANFDEYMTCALNSATRRKLRKKFRASAAGAPIEMSISRDISADIDDVYPLYLQVYNRSKLHFEKLSKDYFCRLGKLMPDKVRFFLWRQNGKIVAFSLCMVQRDAFYAEYVGFDYAVALALHLYHYAVRDMVSWAIANDYKSFRSTALNYDPKLHMRHKLAPLDLYVRHTSPALNVILNRALPWMEPTRYDNVLPMFPDYESLWHKP